jgi:hypothetical protein
MTSDSPLYTNFEAEALMQLRTEFDKSWAARSADAKSVPAQLTKSLYVSWFQQVARQSYGVQSQAGSQVLAGSHAQVGSKLVPVKAKLDDLKSSQKWRRAGAGALGGAATGALIGGALGAGVFSVPGALIGGAIGGIIGGVGGYLW